ncbi:MAG: hypothetical protein CL678_17420 [Bdellovibrionaceae bacterium]|nr:hypothetical protein [Pseudobdellovibrionaceae bacterium]|tara:strand:+ start:1318 stop:1959 length:642 start_codon:yes stop_codon:yes gene_type:complete
MREVPLEVKAMWVEQSCRLHRHSSFEPMDMNTFRAVMFIYTNHYRERQKERDPANALSRIRSAQRRGLHPLFGPPLIAGCLDEKDEGSVIIAAHDMCLICDVKEPNRLVIITTLPMKSRGPHKKFSKFVKFHCPQAIIQKRRPGLKQCRKALDNIDDCNERFIGNRKPIHSKIDIVNADEDVRSKPPKPFCHRWRRLRRYSDIPIRVVASKRK